MLDWDDASRSCLRIARGCAPSEEADDIAQEALIRAWRHRGQLREVEDLRAWLAQIVRREAARARARRMLPTQPDPDRGAHEDQRLLSAPLRADVQGAVTRLDAVEQRLIKLRYEDDLTQAAIAKRLDLPEGTVKVRLHRARQKLRRMLSE